MKDTDLFRKGKIFAETIRDKKIEIMQKNVINQQRLDIMLQIEGELLRDINSELGENGKKIYSNEGLRQTELRKRLKVHSDYIASKQIVDANNSEIDEIHIGLEFARNMLSLVIAFLR